MSYILDALKQQGGMPNQAQVNQDSSHVVHSQHVQAPPTLVVQQVMPAWLTGLLFALLLLLAGGLGYWLGTGNIRLSQQVQVQPAPQTSAQPVTQTVTQPKPESQPVVQAPASQTELAAQALFDPEEPAPVVAEPEPIILGKPLTTAPKAELVSDVKVSSKLKARFAEALDFADEEGETEQEPSDSLMAHDLPQRVQDLLPNMSFSQHIYSSEVGKSYVKVNDVLYHTGDYIEDTVEIVEILPQSLILAIGQDEFMMQALSDWQN